jgi:hypothetical protein
LYSAKAIRAGEADEAQNETAFLKKATIEQKRWARDPASSFSWDYQLRLATASSGEKTVLRAEQNLGQSAEMRRKGTQDLQLCPLSA